MRLRKIKSGEKINYSEGLGQMETERGSVTIERLSLRKIV